MVHFKSFSIILNSRGGIVSEWPNNLSGLAEKSGQELAHSLCDASGLALYMSTCIWAHISAAK
jgi:hypothetical protein